MFTTADDEVEPEPVEDETSELSPEVETPELETEELSENATDIKEENSDNKAKAIAGMWETMKFFLEEFKNLTQAETGNNTEEERPKKTGRKKKPILPDIEAPVDVPLDISPPGLDVAAVPIDNATELLPAINETVGSVELPDAPVVV